MSSKFATGCCLVAIVLPAIQCAFAQESNGTNRLLKNCSIYFVFCVQINQIRSLKTDIASIYSESRRSMDAFEVFSVFWWFRVRILRIFEIGRPPNRKNFSLNHLRRYSMFSWVTMKTN